MPTDVHAEGIDLAVFSAHKIYGPKGVGALMIHNDQARFQIEPLILGGQEHGLHGGTSNAPGIVGFGEASRIARLEWKSEMERITLFRNRLEQSLLRELNDICLNGDTKNRIANTSNISFKGIDARLLIREMNDIAVSPRAACSSGHAGPSHVLNAMGLTDDEAYSCIRLSLGRFTTHDEVDYAIEKIIQSVKKLRRY